MYSLTVLFIVVNGLLSVMTIGLTELIKYSEDDAARAVQEATNLDQNVLGEIHLVGCSLRENRGWIFVILTGIGIIAFITMIIYDRQQKKKNRV